MEKQSDQSELRKEKVELIRDLGINPYPYKYLPDTTASQIRQDYDAHGENTGKIYRIAGRLTAWRDHGNVTFAEIQDQSGTIQIYFQKSTLEDTKQKLANLLDLGDIIGIEGPSFKTRRGEITIRVSNYDLLTKTLLPLPEKRHGLQDPELKYRRRSEFLATDSEQREVFSKRSRAISAMREFLDKENFLEVEIPILQPVYGGASAKPFSTHINALNETSFLSISPELYLKRLIAGGFERVYSIGKNFRNEGLDRTHNPEFTMMECYQSFADYSDMMCLTEEMYSFIFNKVLGKTKIDYQNITGKEKIELDFTPPWKRVKMLDVVREQTGIPVGDLSEEQLRDRLRKLEDPTFFSKAVPRKDLDTWCWGDLTQALFSHYVEPTLIQPTFIIDHPRETTPLCKVHRLDSRLIERFEPFAYGYELGNAYSELNDPILQRKLLTEQVSSRESDEIPGEIDEDFCRAIDFGIPPTGGLGLGIDRLVMFLTNSHTIKDVILFPMMRRERQNGGREK